MTEGYLGLGSNVGDRRANLQAAVRALPRHGVEVLAASSVYETEPVGEVLDQREFFNSCVPTRKASWTHARRWSAISAGSRGASVTGRARSTSTSSCSAGTRSARVACRCRTTR
jgi:2-amino-4-hydroxy-6-hydroxymethyldihydropteridine diphosphokinase